MKYCDKCGKELMDGAIICPGCGCPVEGANSKPAKKKHPARTILIILIIVIACIGVGVFYFLVLTPNKYINMVKGGAPNAYPGQKWGDQVEKAFDDPEWKYEGDSVVSVSGTISKIPVKITFSVNTSNNMFNVTSVEVDGQRYTDALNIGGVIAEIFSW